MTPSDLQSVDLGSESEHGFFGNAYESVPVYDLVHAQHYIAMKNGPGGDRSRVNLVGVIDVGSSGDKSRKQPEGRIGHCLLEDVDLPSHAGVEDQAIEFSPTRGEIQIPAKSYT